MIGEIGYSLELAVWRPDGTCHSEYTASLTADEFDEVFARYVLSQNGGRDNYFWDAEEKQTFIDAGGGWDGIEAVVELNQYRFML